MTVASGEPTLTFEYVRIDSCVSFSFIIPLVEFSDGLILQVEGVHERTIS